MEPTMTTTQAALLPHPYAEIWPNLEGDDFEKLKADIQQNGQRLSILLYQGMILDGRTRHRACLELNLTPVIEQAAATDDKAALALVISLNEHRRHMSYEHRAFAAARLANIKHGAQAGNKLASKTKVSKDTSVLTSIDEAAKAMDIPTPSVKKARAIVENGDKNLEKSILGKKVKLSTAYTAVMTAKKQDKLAQQAASRPSKTSPPTPPRVVKLPPRTRVLTKELVDPEFTGTDMEFAHKYGHVYTQTAEERASSRFMAWAHQFGTWAKHQQQFPLEEIDINWLRSPTRKHVEKLRAAYDILAPILTNLPAVLAKAEGNPVEAPPVPGPTVTIDIGKDTVGDIVQKFWEAEQGGTLNHDKLRLVAEGLTNLL